MIIVKKEDENYPGRLKNIENRPDSLYVIGKLPQDDRPSMAIVGARNSSPYGENLAYEYARFLATAGVQIISGLARGIDSAAHAGALAAGGVTFAVLGCGVDVCYPSSGRKLYDNMKENGGLVSEFEPGAPPLAFHFPMRNRLISGFADGVLVVEAREKSGSLITVDHALDQGKTVFALPGRVGDLLSEGCNRLIYQGAVPAWKPEIILEEMGWTTTNGRFQTADEEKKGLGLAREDDLVYSCLGLNPKTVNQLQEETGLPYGKLVTSLAYLTCSGLAREIWKNHYIRNGVKRIMGDS